MYIVLITNNQQHNAVAFIHTIFLSSLLVDTQSHIKSKINVGYQFMVNDEEDVT